MVKKNKAKNRNIYIVLIYTMAIFIFIVGLTYAYFTINVFNNKDTDSVEIKGGKLELTYGDGNKLLSVLHLKPGSEVGKKTFTVTNTGKSKIDDYEVVLTDVINELEGYEDLKYKLSCVSNKTLSCNGSEGYFPTSDSIIATNSIEIDETQSYTLSIVYNETYKNQSNDLDKTITAKVNIQDSTHMGE